MLIPTDGLALTQDTVFQPGVYFLPGGISIGADGVTLDGNGALLVGDRRLGCGLSILSHKGVTVKNLRLQEYYHGIYAKDCRNLTIAGCRVTSTAETPANTVFLDIWLPVDKAYGGGILLSGVEDSRLVENDLGHQMTGLLCYHCRRLEVRSNQANYCSGCGFLLYNTSHSVYDGNNADFCCRYEPRADRTGLMGADAAGFLIVYNSCHNVFRRNQARVGGDGFFLAGLTASLEPAPCNDNLFEENDGSNSPNIAFEATFSAGNIFRDNYANNSNYGFWLGFSRQGVIESNQITGNRKAGVAVENGVGFQARGNRIQDCDHGLLLWSKSIAQFRGPAPENDTSRDWVIENNLFVHNNKGIRIAADQDHGVRPYRAPVGNSVRVIPHSHTIRSNQFRDNRIGIEVIHCDRTMIEDNSFIHSLEADEVLEP